MKSQSEKLNMVRKKRKGASFYIQQERLERENKPLVKTQTSGKRLFKYILITFFVVLGASLIIFLWTIISATTSVFHFSFWATPLKQEEGRINVLLLGNAGGTHDGAELTDSIIIASYDLKTKNALLISIPRDVWVNNVNQKINTLYEVGKQRKNGANGLKFAEEKIGNLIDLPIQYGIRLNFDGFAKAVDLVDGIDVNVPRTFDDYNYPIQGKENDWCGYQEKEVTLTEDFISKLNLKVASDSASSSANAVQIGDKKKVMFDPLGQVTTTGPNFSCRFEHISFQKGMMHMDGNTALKFVRSRKGTNGEGTDYARSRRQQLVIQSFREKALSMQTLANPQKILGLISTLGQSVETDIPGERVSEFYGFAKNLAKVDSIVLGDLGNGQSLFITPPAIDYGGAWVLVPPDKDFTKVQILIKDKIKQQESSASANSNQSVKSESK